MKTKHTLRVMALTAIFLIISTSCRFPFTAKETGTATQPASDETPSAEPVTVQAAENLPPEIVEANPLPGSTVAAQQQFILVFNQPMDQPSVESGLAIAPSVPFQTKWVDERSLELTLDEPLPLESAFSLTFADSVRSTGGLEAGENIVLDYRTAGPLLLTDVLPKPDQTDVNPGGVIMVSFNQPVVDLGLSPTVKGFELEPEAEGRGEWLNTSTYVFYPQPGLAGGIEYTLKLNRDLTSLQGTALDLAEDRPAEWTFKTSPPQLLTVEPTDENPIDIDTDFVVTFNETMDSVSVEQQFSLADETGEEVDGNFAWNDISSVLTFTPLEFLQRDTAYLLKIGAGAAGAGGTQLGEEIVYRYRTVGNLTVQEIIPSPDVPLEIYSGYSSLQIHFNAPIADADFADFVTFEPALIDPYYYRGDPNSLFLSGYFKGSTVYHLTLSGDLTDKWGEGLGEDFSLGFSTAPVQPQFSIPLLNWGVQTLFITPHDETMLAQAVNTPFVDLLAEETTLGHFIELVSNPQGFPEVDFSGQAVSWRQYLDLAPDTSQKVDIYLRENRQALSPGLYLYKVNAAGQTSQPWPFLMVVSDYSILVKRSETQVFAWVVDLNGGQPAGNFDLKLYSTSTDALASCVTDADGKCTFDLARELDYQAPVLVMHGQPGEEDFSLGTGAWQMGVNGADFGFYSYGEPGEMIYLYTDRPIYRPGQTVYFRFAVRDENNARYNLPDRGEIHIEVNGKYEEETGEVPLLETIPVNLSDFGSGWGSFDIPEDAGAGYYSLHVSEFESSYLGFQVADYRKPEIDVQVDFNTDQAMRGDDLRANVTASYYFGASAANVPLHWVLYSAGEYFDLPYGYQTGKQPFPWEYHIWNYMMNSALGTWVIEGNAETGQDGSVQIEIPFEDIKTFIPQDTLRRLTLEVTVQDNSELPVSARDILLYHPEAFYIGVKPEQWSGTAGTPLGFAIQTVDLQKNAAAGIKLSAVLKKINWVTQWNEISGYRETKPEYKEVSSVNLQTDADGRSRLEMIPEEPGIYQLEIDGGNASTQVMAWVGGTGSASWPDLSDQEVPVTLDQDSYQVGDTANLFIPNPFSDALALITIERSNVMSSYVMEVDGSELEFSFEIEDKYAPNVYASITLIHTNGENGYDFRQGYVSIPVDPQRLSLQVDLQATPAAAEPGGSVALALTASDWQGNPVEGEFSISLVDKAVLALAEPNAKDILTAFYDTQPLFVRSSLSLAGYAGRRVSPAADGLGGGGGMETALFLREDFKDTAYWNGSVITDANGRAEVAVQLPDNVTTWVALARGLTKDTLAGEAQTEIVVSRPLLISPVAPRFAVVGDHMQVAALAHNNTTADLSANISLQAIGFSLDEKDAAPRQVEVPAGGSQRVAWWGTVQNVEKMDLTFSAVSEAYQDAATPETGSILVLHYSSPQTFATSGLLGDAGELLETVSLPHTWQPTGGNLTVEIAPSMAASILKDMKALKNYDMAFTETIVSLLLPNLEMLGALKTFDLENPDLEAELTAEIRYALEKLPDLQGEDGGWGWMKGEDSDIYLSSYVLIGLTRAVEEGFNIDSEMVQKTRDYLKGNLQEMNRDTPQWELDRQVFQNYALLAAGAEGLDSHLNFEYRDRMSPWAKALLSLCISMDDPQDSDISVLVDDIESLADLTATGVHWAETDTNRRNLGSSIFNSSVVIYALARLDPASSLLPAAVRYLAAHRNAGGGWNSSYESAWSLRALIEVMKGTGELQSNFDYSASLNGAQMISGRAEGLEQLITVTGSVPISDLLTDMPNALRIRRGEGEGKLHYRAYLQVDRPVEDVQAVERGISVERAYSLWGEDCTSESCTLIREYSLSENDMPVLVHVTVTVPEEMFYVVVEDWLPAGTEIVNPNLLITQQGSGISEDIAVEPLNSDVSRWGSWYFGQPEIHADHVRWVAPWLPAGTYELTYRFTAYLQGEYRILPARAWQYYFPEVEGASVGQIFSITE